MESLEQMLEPHKRKANHTIELVYYINAVQEFVYIRFHTEGSLINVSG